MKRIRTVFAGAALALLALLCAANSGCGARVPDDARAEAAKPAIYPDYDGVLVPCNIAPLNFRIEEDGDAFLTTLTAPDGSRRVFKGRDVAMTIREWRKLTEKNKGAELKFETAVKRGGEWIRFEPVVMTVSENTIDGWVAYRLIEPGYDYGTRIMLAQRSLTNWDERVFFDTRGVQSCVNCHSFQNWDTENFMFHFRKRNGEGGGGTITVLGDSVRKLSGRIDPVEASCSYPAWRPNSDLIAFSSNRTFQIFHSLSSQKIEVYDVSSDLVLLDPHKNEALLATRTEDQFETFPNWAPDGSALYYACANVRLETRDNSNNERSREASSRTEEFRYGIYRRPFDEKTGTLGEPELVVDAAAQGRSALFPRVDPTGNYLIYTLAESGTFPIWRPEADLWLKNLRTGEERALDEVNGPNADSFHSWDSSGKWFIFSSRREDGQYTRLYIAGFDSEGRAAKPFLMPQKDPTSNRRFFRSYNVPELTKAPIRMPVRKLYEAAEGKSEPTVVK